MKKIRAFVPALDGRLEDRVVPSGAKVSALLAPVASAQVVSKAALPSSAILTTRTYNSVLVNIHKAFVQYGKSAGSTGNFNTLINSINGQLARIPYANKDGLINAVNQGLVGLTPADARAGYSAVRSTTVNFLGSEVNAGFVGIYKSKGHYFSDPDIYGPKAFPTG